MFFNTMGLLAVGSVQPTGRACGKLSAVLGPQTQGHNLTHTPQPASCTGVQGGINRHQVVERAVCPSSWLFSHSRRDHNSGLGGWLRIGGSPTQGHHPTKAQGSFSLENDTMHLRCQAFPPPFLRGENTGDGDPSISESSGGQKRWVSGTRFGDF